MNRGTITDETMMQWLKKIEKYSKKEQKMLEYPKRGDIWTMDFGIGVGSEIRGVRPVFVLSSSLINEKNKTLLVLPITKRSETHEAGKAFESEFEYHLPLHPELFQWGGDKVNGVIKTEAIYTKSRGCIGKRIGRLNDEGIEQVTELVSKVLHLREPISSEEDFEKIRERESRKRLNHSKHKEKAEN